MASFHRRKDCFEPLAANASVVAAIACRAAWQPVADEVTDVTEPLQRRLLNCIFSKWHICLIIRKTETITKSWIVLHRGRVGIPRKTAIYASFSAFVYRKGELRTFSACPLDSYRVPTDNEVSSSTTCGRSNEAVLRGGFSHFWGSCLPNLHVPAAIFAVGALSRHSMRSTEARIPGDRRG